MEHFERSGSIEGRITDRDSGQPLYGVTVSVEDTHIVTRTDIRGRFRISSIPSGECILRCHLEGYRIVTTKALKIAPGQVTRFECELAPRGTIPLNEPVILLPLRLEIRKHFPQSSQEIARYTAANVATTAFSETTSRRVAPFATSSVFEFLQPQKSEYWIRWYPDDIHYLTTVGKITDEERVAWERFWHFVVKHRDLGSIKGLYAQEPYNLSIEVLETFYGIRSGRLTDNEILRCNAYDELARQRIENEQQGVRDVLDWQDMVNPEVKKAWIEFAKEFGAVRARQIARDMLEGNWDFDTDNEEDEPLDILVNQGMPLTTLPDEITIYAIKDGQIDLVAKNLPIDNKSLIVAPTELEGTHWMTDFNKALDAGMGTIIRDEDKVKLIDQADWLIVVGVNDSKEARNVLEEIFRRNNASGELGILAQDSPTNNTDTSSTPYTSTAPDAEEYLRKTRMKIPADDIPVQLRNQLTYNILDSHRLSYLFGVSESTFSQMPVSNSTEITEAGAMAALLWTSCTLHYEKTWGTQLRQYAHLGSQPLQFNLGNFFIQNVRSRGSYPILRFDENPYGILPVMSMRDWCKTQVLYRDTPDRPNEIICRFINILKNTFLTLKDNVPRIDETAEDTYETLLEILRSSPVSKRVDVRAFNSRNPNDMSEDAKYLNCPLVKDALAGNVAGSALPFPEIAYLSELSHINRPDFDATSIRLENNSPLLKRLIVYFLRQVFPKANYHQRFEIKGTVRDSSTGKPISGATVTCRGIDLSAQTNERGEFSIVPVPSGNYDFEVTHPDYAGHLTVNVIVQSGKTNEHIFSLEPTNNTENNITDEDVADTLPLDESGKTIWVKVIDQESGAVLKGVFVHLLGTGRSTLTDSAGEYRFENLPDGDHRISIGAVGYDVSTFYVTLAQHSSKSTVIVFLNPIKTSASAPNTVGTGITIPGGLQLIADAANTLVRVNPDKLEILLLETLDLFSHRLDAWLTGFANARLIECLREIQKPPQIGVFGWLEKPGKLNNNLSKSEFIQAPSVRQATTAAILRNAAINNGEDVDSTAFQINLSSSQVRAGTWYLEGIRQGHLPGELLGYRLERLIHEASNPTATNGITTTTNNNANPIKEKDIYELRKKYPLILHEDQINTNESTRLVIIDGEKFLNDKDSDSKFDSIKAHLNQIKDAAADIVICEVVNADGDIALRGGWLDFLDGDGLPPAEEFIRSRRTGDVHGIKVLLQISPPENLVAGKSVTNPRIIADPILAHFCESLMPDFGSKEVVANLVKADKTKRPITFFARDLNIHPIDLVIGGVEELRLRIRYYLLSRWKASDLSDGTIPSPFSIFGPFPAHDLPNEPLNDIGIEISTPTNSGDAANFLTYVTKAKSIRKLLHQNKSKDSGSTVSPDQLPIIADHQLEQLDLMAGIELLSNRLRQLQNQLVDLVSTTIVATSVLKMRLIVLHGLHDFRQSVLMLKERMQSGAAVDDLIDLLELKLINLTDSDHDLFDLMTNAETPPQLDQLRNNQDTSLESIDLLLAKLSDIEREFGAHIEYSAKLLVADANLPLLEISQFGLETALTVLPDEPTITASVKIIKLFDRLIFDLTEKLSSVLSDSSGLKDYVHCLRILYIYGAEINQILCQYINNPTNALNQLTSRLPLTKDQAQLIIVVQFQNMNYFEPLLVTFLDNIDAMNQKPTYYEDYPVVAKLIIADNQGVIYNIVKNSTSMAEANLMNTINISQNQAEIITGLGLEDLNVFNTVRIQELMASVTQNKLRDIISLLQACIDKQGMVILTPYLLAGEQNHGPNWTFDYTKLVHLTGSTYLQEYIPVRTGISNLFDAFDVASQLYVYEDKHYQRIDPIEIDFKPEGNTDFVYLTYSSDPQVSVTCLTFLLVDQWQEGIPNPEQSEVTGMALRYESPQAEAPNAIIVAVPPYKSSNEYWSVDLLANTLLETLELMQIRMVGSHNVADSVLGRLLPILLFSPVDNKPLFPSKERLLYPDGINPDVGYTLATHMSRATLSRTRPPTVRNEAPDIGDVHV
jgi:hypothetical protein